MAEREFSRNQLDKLGRRLLVDEIADEDLDSLTRYRVQLRSGTRRTLLAVRVYAQARGFAVSERPEKTLSSIRRKLRETTVHLGDMNDLVGCRITVPDRITQYRVRADLDQAFRDVRWIDRNRFPSNGYRAIHGIRRAASAVLEIQIRTTLQDLWANLSESLADRYGDISIKYGGGPDPIRGELGLLSHWIDGFEMFEDIRVFEQLTAPERLADDAMDEEMLVQLSDQLDGRTKRIQELRDDTLSRIAKLGKSSL